MNGAGSWRLELVSAGDLKRLYREVTRCGSCGSSASWFDAATMRLFRSRIAAYGSAIYDGSVLLGVVFVSSERPGDRRREYTVRLMTGAGCIRNSTTDGLGAYSTGAAASRAAHRLALWLVSGGSNGEG